MAASRAEMAALLAQCFPGTELVDRMEPNRLPSDKGAYLLAIRLAGPLPATLRTARFTLSAGWYIYAGSAKGPGGIRARLSRHFRREKKPHWHVDQLTVAAAELAALPFPGGVECELVARVQGLSKVSVPQPGFGSSDCRVCPAHLLGLA